MDIKILVSIITSGLILFLAGWVWLANPKSRINFWYSLTMASAGLWGLSEISILRSWTPNLAMLSAIISFIIGITIPFCFLIFSFYFPYQEKIVSRKILLVITLLYVIAVSIAAVPGGLVRQGIILPEHGDYVKNHFGFLVWIVIYIIFFGWSYINLFRKLRRSLGFVRKQLSYLIVFTLIPVILATIFDVLIPFFSSEALAWVGVQSLLISVLGGFYYLTFLGRKIYLQ